VVTAPQNEAPSSRAPQVIVGLHGAGQMGSGLGWALRAGGARVITTLAGRSERTKALASTAGIEFVEDLDTLVATASHILVVTPPDAAVDAARSLAEAARRTGDRPLVADMNAISPTTSRLVAEAVAPLPYVDGSISGPPPTVRPGARLYFAGPRAADFTGLPWQHVSAIDLGPTIGAASALKMSTASVYKGLVGLFAQAMSSAAHYGVLRPVLDDLAGAGYSKVRDVALAGSKAHRYVAEMREISAAQEAAGLPGSLFAAFAEVYAQIADSALADADPESVPPAPTAEDVITALGTPSDPGTRRS
jgi:3-hydroxyisobutyrate dehydrogenase-like beta-hydroxyacid dehydrogenase